MDFPYLPPKRRLHIFPAWVRYTAWFVIAIAGLEIGIHWFFAMMPAVAAVLPEWVAVR